MTDEPARSSTLARHWDDPAAPVRIAHLGLGNFFRAHQAVYTARADDAAAWGIAAFGGRSAEPARDLAAQGGLYTLVTRGAEADQFDRIDSISAAFAGADHEAWLRCLRAPELACVTMTVTEFGYHRAPNGGLDISSADVLADITALQTGTVVAVTTAPARLVAGLAARRRVDAGPITVLSCDNLPGNGEATRRVVTELAELIDPGLREWVEAQVSFPASMVDRITPRPDTGLSDAVLRVTGVLDNCPIVTEPFSEWVIAGAFAAGRPDWASSGVTFAADIKPHERRKLRMLNGAHSLLAYVGLDRGLATVADAIEDDYCRDLVLTWWREAGPGLGLPIAEVEDYCARLIERWSNRRIAHRLDQIAADGSQKLPIRVIPVLAEQRDDGAMPAAAIAIIAAWIRYLRRTGTAAVDGDLAKVLRLVDAPSAVVARSVLDYLGANEPRLREDAELATALAAELA